LQILEIKWL